MQRDGKKLKGGQACSKGLKQIPTLEYWPPLKKITFLGNTENTKHPFYRVLTCFGRENKTGVVRVVRLFFKVDLCSAISFKSSPRELSISVAELRFILKITKY